MKNIIIFGFGEMGKKLIQECLTYELDIQIKAIVDNNCLDSIYKNIPVIKPQFIDQYTYDEIWVCTVYFEEVVVQLSEEYHVDKKKIHYVEPVVPILESRLRKKYECQINALSTISSELEVVLSYLKDNHLHMYCYPFYDEYRNKNTPIYFDDKANMYFGIYEGKRIYLAQRLNTVQKARAYFNAVIMEQDMRSPHCYWNNKLLCKKLGIGVDVGAAEGIFALKVIEEIKCIYLIEADEQWVEALEYTFAPYRDKVHIIRKFAGNKDCEDIVKLDTILKGEKIDFMKMDIEGMELEALKGSENIILNNKIALAICVYHHEKDNEQIGQWLIEREYHIGNYRGLVVCQGDWELKNNETDFRKALLFASNN